VILAAGASRRMGKNKMLLELDGESLIRRAASVPWRRVSRRW